MTKRISTVVFLFWIAAPGLPAQEEAAGEITPLKLELTLSPSPDGSDRETSFVVHLLADSNRTTTLRAGREVAVPVAGNQYRNVGINVTCRAWTDGDGFRLDLELERSSLVEGSDAGRPSFHTFSTSSSLRLRDGEACGWSADATARPEASGNWKGSGCFRFWTNIPWAASLESSPKTSRVDYPTALEDVLDFVSALDAKAMLANEESVAAAPER
jgi:hypothetical protein